MPYIYAPYRRYKPWYRRPAKKSNTFDKVRKTRKAKLAVTHPTEKYGTQRYGKEEMHVCNYSTSGNVGGGSARLSTVLMVQGDDVIYREGRKTLIRHYELRMEVINKLGVDSNAGAIRVLIIHDKHPNGALATAASMNNYGAGLEINGSIPNLLSGNRFDVLYDEVKTIGGTNTGSDEAMNNTAPAAILFNASFPCYIPQTYSTADGAIADLTEGNVIVYIIPDQNQSFDYYLTTTALFRN